MTTPAGLPLDDARLDDPRLADRWPATLVTMVDVIRDRYRRRGLDQAEADALARLAVTALSDYMGARPLYLPRGDTLRKALRDKEIWEQFDGVNVFALAERHRLSTKQIYEILAEQRALHRSRVQPGLFGEG